MKRRGDIAPLIITSVIVALVAIGGLFLRRHQREHLVPMLTHAVELDEQTLLVRDADGAWRALRLDGSLADVAPLGTRARVVAHTDGVLWLQSEEEPLAAVRTSGLTPIPAVATAARQLQAPLVPRGVTRDGELVVQSGDGLVQRIGLDGAARPAADVEILPAQPFDASRGGRGQRLGLRQAPPWPGQGSRRSPAPLRLTQLKLIDPEVVMRWASGRPLTLEDPDSYLVVSAKVLGDQGDQQLSRVGLSGQVHWSVSTADLATGPSARGDAARRVLWVGVRDGALVALVQAWWREARSDTKLAPRDERGTPSLVRLAPTTGAVTQRITIQRRDARP